jgi:hypothetical protein
MPVSRSKQTESKAGTKAKSTATEAQDAPPTKSRAAAFDSVKPLGAVDAGKYEAIIPEFVLQDPNEKGQAARIKYEIASEGEMQGETVTQFYSLFDAEGQPGKGAAFLKKDLAVMGYPDCSFDDLETVFEEIVEKLLGVVITVKQNGQWTNAYLNGLAEGSDVVSEYLEKRPY